MVQLELVKPSRGHVTQWYGNIQPDGNPHAGQDYAYTNGTEIFPEVYAAADGVVLFAGDSRGLAWPNVMYLNIDFDRTDNVDSSAGNYIILGHYDGTVRVAFTGYGHLEEVRVTTGQTVRAGQQIAVCGATGNSRGKHLHFDFVPAPFNVSFAPLYGRVDPNPYFTGLSYAGTITPLEDDMTPEEKKLLFEVLDALNTRTATLPGQKDELRYWGDLIGAVDKTNNGVAGLVARPAADIAAQLNAAGIAAAVRDELVKLIGGAK